MAERSAFSRPISAAFGKATGVFSRPKLQRRACTAHTAGELISRLPHLVIDFNEEKQRDNHINEKERSSEEIVPAPCPTTQVDLNSNNNDNNSHCFVVSSSIINYSSNTRRDCGSIGADVNNNNNYNCKENINYSCIGNSNVVNTNTSIFPNKSHKNNNNCSSNKSGFTTTTTTTRASNMTSNNISTANDSNKGMMAHSNTVHTQNAFNFPHKEITHQHNDEHQASKPKINPKTDFSTSDRVQDIIRETLKGQLIHMEYKHRECGEKGRAISQMIEKSVKTLIGSTYKVTVLVYIGALRDKGIDLACQCSWSPGIDFFAMETYKTQSIFASATVFATIYE